MMPWETFLQVIIFILIGLGVTVALLMYLDGYWKLERRKERWNRTHFTKWH